MDSKRRESTVRESVIDSSSRPSASNSPAHDSSYEESSLVSDPMEASADVWTDMSTEPTSNFSSNQIEMAKAIQLNWASQPGATRVYPSGYKPGDDFDDVVVDTGLYDSCAVHLDGRVFQASILEEDRPSDLPAVQVHVLAGRYFKRKQLVLATAGLISVICVACAIGAVMIPTDGSRTIPSDTISLPTTVEKLAISLRNYTVAALQSELPAASRTSDWYNSMLWLNSSNFQPRSPQGKAWKWLMSHPNLENQPMLRDRFGLATLYYATNGPKWKKNTNWLSTKHVCQWWSEKADHLLTYPKYLKDCQSGNGETELMALRLPANGLDGELPPELGLLTSLLVVRLIGNELHGTIHDDIWKSWQKVVTLDLTSNDFSGSIPSLLGLFTDMVTMYVDRTGLEGSLPSELGLLSSNLERMYAGDTLLSGRIPTEIGNLRALLDFRMINSRLTGPIPSTIAGLKSCQIFYVGVNKLSGTIPSEISLCRKLQTVDLSHNDKLNGTIPTEITRLPALEEWYMNNCNVTGPLLSGLAKVTTLRMIDVSNSRITGTVASEFGQLTKLNELRIYGTDMQGNIPRSVCDVFTANRANDGLMVDCDRIVCRCNCSCAT